MLNSDFFNTLFDQDEATCFSKDIYTTTVYAVKDHQNHSDSQFFCINPLSSTDRHPTKEKHKKEVPRKADANVTVFRNILLEIDKDMTIEQQKAFFEGIEMPHSTVVFSGSKSLHYIIALETALDDEKAYRALVKRVHAAASGKPDPATKNPSRFSRFPNAFRTDKGNTQSLVHVGKRINNEELEAWLISRGALPEVKKDPIADNTFVYKPLGLSPYTQVFLMGKYKDGRFNDSLYLSGLDMFRHNYSFETAVELIEKGLNEPLDYRAIASLRSAYDTVAAEK